MYFYESASLILWHRCSSVNTHLLPSLQPRHIPRGAPSDMGRFGAFPIDGAAQASEPLVREADEGMMSEVRNTSKGFRLCSATHRPYV